MSMPSGPEVAYYFRELLKANPQSGSLKSNLLLTLLVPLIRTGFCRDAL